MNELAMPRPNPRVMPDTETLQSPRDLKQQAGLPRWPILNHRSGFLNSYGHHSDLPTQNWESPDHSDSARG